jgi:hypothetical protein
MNEALERVKQEAATAYMAVLPQHLPYIGPLLSLYLTTVSCHFLLVCLSLYQNHAADHPHRQQNSRGKWQATVVRCSKDPVWLGECESLSHCMVGMPTMLQGYVICEVHALGKETHFIIGTVFTVWTGWGWRNSSTVNIQYNTAVRWRHSDIWN